MGQALNAPSEPFLELGGVTKSFGPRSVLKGIDLKLGRGDFLTIFGPNGAGKTTLLKILSTISRPSSGTLRIGGIEATKNPVEARRLIGVVSHDSMLYGNLTAAENLRFYGKMYDVASLEDKVNALIDQVGLDRARNQRAGTFSHGMLKRLSIARAFLHDPPLLLLDEPETGLDQQGITMLMDTLKSLGAERRTIIMTTHSLERGVRSCNQVAILARGRIVYREASERLAGCTFDDIYLRHTEAA